MLINWKIYILSVKEIPERRIHVEKLAEKLKNIGFYVEIIDGYFWKSINVVDVMNHLGLSFDHNSNLSQSQIACFLTHRLAWEKINESYDEKKNEIPIILEDDMDLNDFELFLKIEKEIYDLHNNYDGIIMWKHPDKLPNSNITFLSDYLIELYNQWGTCAYNISHELSKKLLSINFIDRPLDNYLYEIVYPNYKIIMTFQDPFINLGFLAGNTISTDTKFTSLIWE